MKKNVNWFKRFLNFGKQIHLFEFMFWCILISPILIYANVPLFAQMLIQTAIAGAFFNTWDIEKKYRDKLKELESKETEVKNENKE